MALADYKRTTFAHGDIEREVFTRSPERTPERGIIVIHEVPGVTPAVLDFADRLVERGATVWLPSLTGIPGRAPNAAYIAQAVAKICVAKEFALFAANETPPITEWLKALAQLLSESLGGQPVGALGMCFSGGFALAMAADPVVSAPVLSQPAAPLRIGADRAGSLSISPADLEAVKANGCNVMGLRFTGDLAVPPDRFTFLARALGDRFTAIEIVSPDRDLSINRTAHSVLTKDLIDVPGHPTYVALEQVLEFFEAQLPAPAAAG